MKWILLFFGMASLLCGIFNPYVPIDQRIFMITVGAGLSYLGYIMIPNNIFYKIKRKMMEDQFIREEENFKKNK